MECFLSGEGNRSRLPKSFDGGIFTKLGVTGEEGHFFSQTLGDENAVERVAVMKGKVNRATDMGPRDGKWFCDLLIDPLFSEALQPAQKLEFFKGYLDGEFPKCGFADP